MPKVSIVVPVYKAEKYLERCVSSLQNQTIQDLEIILVDDGSPDNCPILCDELAQTDNRIRVVHKKNGGVSSARNAGLDVAAGDYITFVDSDDYVDSDMYATLLEKARQYDCDLVMCDCVKEFTNNTELYTHEIRSGYYSQEQLEKEYYPHLLMMENVEYPATISNCLLLFRRELAEKIRYLTGVRYSEDLLFGAQLMLRAKSFYYLKGQAYYHYVMNSDSATHQFIPDKWNDYVKLHGGIRKSFGKYETYDFTRQIDLCLLFFLYNVMGETMRTNQLEYLDKVKQIKKILSTPVVREMFDRLKIDSLDISKKQRLITWLYKKQWGISLLIKYYERK